MEHVLGIGGYFTRAEDPAALGPTVFATFESETESFASREQQTIPRATGSCSGSPADAAPRCPGAEGLGTPRGTCPDETARGSEDARGMVTTELTPRGSTFDEELIEIDDLVGAVPIAGPPALLVAGPLVLIALLVAGPFAFLLVLVVAMVAAAGLLALLGAILASPYLLARRLRRHRGAGWAAAASGRA